MVQKYEQEIGGIHLDPSYGKDNAMYFSVKNPHTLSSRYADVYEQKAHLVIRMLELHIGQELLMQVRVRVHPHRALSDSDNSMNGNLIISCFISCLLT